MCSRRDGVGVDVRCVRERLGHKLCDVVVDRPVEDPVAVPAGVDEPGPAKLREALRHRGLANAEGSSELAYRMLTAQQDTRDPKARGIGEQLQHTNGLTNMAIVCALNLCARTR